MGDIFLQAVLFIYNTIGLQNLGISIIEIAVLSRIVFYPFIKQQLTYSKKMGEMQPHIAALKEKHKDDKQGMAKAQMDLFKEHGVNPAAGCLPTIVQLIVLIGLFGALDQILKMNFNTNFAFWNMAKPDVFHIQGINFALPGVLVIIAAATQFIQSKMMLVSTPPGGGLPKPALTKEGSGEVKSDFASEFSSAQSSMMWMFPLMFLWFGTQWPSGLALYWSISSTIAIYQQYKISGLGGMEELWKKLMSLKK